MRRRIKQIITDIRRGRFVDLYAATFVSFAFAVALLVGEDLPESLRWSLLFAGVGLLLWRSTVSRPREQAFLDRSDYDRNPIANRLRAAKDVWIFAPVGANLLTEERCEILRRGPLAHNDGSVRVVVLQPFDPDEPISEQLDALLDYPVQKAAAALSETHDRLAAMGRWAVRGSFAFGSIAFNPGFSIVAVDPNSSGGFANVEFHGFRNDAIGSRMHIHLTGADGRWYTYWLEQFEAIWRSAAEAETVAIGAIEAAGEPA